MPRHTPKDSLTYLGNMLDLLIAQAQEEITGVNLSSDATEQIPDELVDDIPEHVTNGMEFLDYARKMLRYEVEIHRANTVMFSTGCPTHLKEKEPVAHEREDGITEITAREVISHPYPDGGKNHPLARKSPAHK